MINSKIQWFFICGSISAMPGSNSEEMQGSVPSEVYELPESDKCFLKKRLLSLAPYSVFEDDDEEEGANHLASRKRSRNERFYLLSQDEYVELVKRAQD